MIPLLLATRNPHKTREFAEILGSSFALSDLSGVDDGPVVEETGKTFQENAELKALAASRGTAGLVVADDSGLEVAALGNAPGIYSARFAGKHATDAENVAKLLAELQNTDPKGSNRAARFCCAIAVARAGAILDVFTGTVEGVIIDTPHGGQGFGYDPIFVPNGFEKTFAELGADVKNRISHRAAAIAALCAGLARLAEPDA